MMKYILHEPCKFLIALIFIFPIDFTSRTVINVEYRYVLISIEFRDKRAH